MIVVVYADRGRCGVTYIEAMPSLLRLLLVLGLLSGLGYGAILTLATFVEPKPREIIVTIPQDRLNKDR